MPSRLLSQVLRFGVGSGSPHRLVICLVTSLATTGGCGVSKTIDNGRILDSSTDVPADMIEELPAEPADVMDDHPLDQVRSDQSQRDGVDVMIGSIGGCSPDAGDKTSIETIGCFCEGLICDASGIMCSVSATIGGVSYTRTCTCTTQFMRCCDTPPGVYNCIACPKEPPTVGAPCSGQGVCSYYKHCPEDYYCPSLQWESPPPPYPCVVNVDGGANSN